MELQWKLFFLILCLAPLKSLTSQETEREIQEIQLYEATPDSVEIEDFAFLRHYTKDRFGRKITFYLSKIPGGDEQKRPLVVCIQGSGSQSLFWKIETANGERIVSGGPEAVVMRQFKDRVRVLVVEKPGVNFLDRPNRPGGSEEGSKEFNEGFTLDRWVEAVVAAIKASQTLEQIDSAKTLVLGHSEGGQIACEVASKLEFVSHVAVMAGGGPTQLFDFIQLARQGAMFDPNATPQERVDDLLLGWKQVLENPTASDQFFLGHAHLRWSTFLESSPVAAILKSKAKVFIAQGTEDTNSLPASADLLFAELLARGRDCTYERVEGGNHGFMTEDDNGKGWFDTNRKAIDWFLNEDSSKDEESDR